MTRSVRDAISHITAAINDLGSAMVTNELPPPGETALLAHALMLARQRFCVIARQEGKNLSDIAKLVQLPTAEVFMILHRIYTQDPQLKQRLETERSPETWSSLTRLYLQHSATPEVLG